MMKSRRISDLMKPKAQLVIKDRHKLLTIYDEYLQGHFITVCNLINEYDDNIAVFFTDLLIHLNQKYTSDAVKSAKYWHFYDLYFVQLTT